MTFTKALIAKKIADDCGFMKGEAVEIFEKMLEIMKAKLVAGEDVMMSGFGKWSVKSKHARRGRNPKTGEPMVLDARRVVTWKYSPRAQECHEWSQVGFQIRVFLFHTVKLHRPGGELWAMQEEMLAAVRSGDLAKLRMLLTSGVDLDSRDPLGWSALMWASALNLPHVVRVLLECGADTEVTDQYGATALMKACRQDSIAIADLLLKYGADIDAVDALGWTALMRAAHRGFEEVVQLLLEHFPQSEIADHSGATALILAASEGHATVTKQLLEWGADMHAKDIRGKTALTWAVSRGHTAVVDLLNEWQERQDAE